MAGNLTTLINRMVYWCRDVSLGYSQADRWNIKPGGNADCSSLVIHCLKEAGFDTGSATYTGNMSAQLTARGWTRVAANGSPRAGDILLNDVHHVAVYLGNGLLAQASISEHGTAYGSGGDQTGHETNVRNYYDYPWNCYLRYAGSQPTPSTATPAAQTDYSLLEDDMPLLIQCNDDHAGYRKGDQVLWSPLAPTAFYHIPNTEALKIVRMAYPGIKTQVSQSKAPWIVRAMQATPPANRASYGKR
ncbi:MAG: NlpC/P60 family protein [Bifidobacterium psychraerophilum]|uniref:NlpC/P60 family protein n=1 Tax=Bifidobacterium psychraerophilum TaxID=218140 RepID=UPI0039E97088